MANDLVAHSWCWECYRAYFRAGHHKRKATNNKRATEWQQNNREKARAAAKKWKAANDDKVRTYAQAQYWSDPETHRARSRAWSKANPDRVLEIQRNRRAKKAAAVGTHTKEDIEKLLLLQRSRCAYCRKELKGRFHVDHILPLSLGGANDPRNLQLTCGKCNLSKGARHPLDHARLIGRLV